MASKYNSANLTSSLSDPQIKLGKAFADRNLEEFRSALMIGANPLAIDDKNLTVFDKALQTAGCVEFVAECLRYGCDQNYVNKFFNKAAINFATDSRDPVILETFLSKSGIKVDHVYSALTPLNSLAKNLNDENFNDVIKCMRILIEYGASPNIPDQRGMTPLHNVLKNRKLSEHKKYEIIPMFLNLPNIDIDTYREGELRTILETEYPLMELPMKSQSNLITYHKLVTYIRDGNESTFQEKYNDISRNTTTEEDLLLFVESIERGVHKVFDLLLASGVDYNQTVRRNNLPIEIAWIYGNWYALEKLLQQPNIKIRSKDYPLCHIICKLNENSPQDFCNYWKCFYVLLNSEKININARDFSKSTALHYAVKYHNNRAVKELLNRGACICLENAFDELPISGMSPTILEEHLNDCISSSNDKLGDKNYEIIINFRNFMPDKERNHKHLMEVITPIAYMAKSKEYRYLLQHPVITSILYLKWHKLSLVFYINFLVYLFFAVSIVTHIVLKFRESDHRQPLLISLYCSWLGICYLVARESLQLLMSPIKYLFSFTNYMEILLIIVSILSCKDFNIDRVMQRNIAVACILLTAYDLCLLVGSLPVSSISTHMLMLEAVCKSFLKGFLLYSIFIVTFTLCFYIKSDKPEEGTKDDGELFHKFPNPLVAFAKTIVMFTGEFDAGSLKLDSNYSYLLFLSFVFFMTIILFNLLNGLAVSDTQAIKDQAELNDIICRTNLLSRYERMAFDENDSSLFSIKCQPFRYLCHIFRKSFPTYTTDIEISILPNDKNKILKKETKPQLNNEELKDAVISLVDDDDDQSGRGNPIENRILGCWFSFLIKNCSRIDGRTVTQAMAVLEKKSIRSVDSRLESLEDKLSKIMKHLRIRSSDHPTECI